MKHDHNFQRLLDSACNANQCMLVSDFLECIGDLIASQPEKLTGYKKAIDNPISNVIRLEKQIKFFGLHIEYESKF